jgi:tol-pal system protein YbgF
MTARPIARGRKAGWAVSALLLAAALATPGCYTAQEALLKSGLDSLRTQVDMMAARDSVSAQLISDTQRELAEQKDLILATRATATSTSRESSESLDRMEGKLDDIMARFRIVSERQPPPRAVATTPTDTTGGAAKPAGGAPASAGPANTTQLYDQATTDLTQGRYPMALNGYRNYLQRFPDTDLADNAQYGVGECFFAQARFDSALVEYRQVGARWSSGDRAPAALYKVGLCQERLGRKDEAKQTFEDLVKRFPQSGEAQLARDRIGVKL